MYSINDIKKLVKKQLINERIQEYAEYLRNNKYMSCKMCRNKEFMNLICNFPCIGDNVRIGTLIRISQEIHNKHLSGSIAEVGVYRGEFANKIRILFPDRKFYLFDTFEGFTKEEMETAKTEMELKNFTRLKGPLSILL